MTDPELEAMFPGDSELASRVRAFDWSTTPLGPPAGWPENLRIALGICLTSRFALHVWWGDDMTLLYNDAYASILGPTKHPAALGQSGRKAWAEVWDTIGPMLDSVITTREASWSEDIGMFFDRELPREEVYVTFSFSPILGKNQHVDGLFCACTETTEKIIGARRLETLRKLGIEAMVGRSVDDACAAVARALAENPYDVPAAVLYLPDGDRLRAVAWIGLADGAADLPRVVSRTERGGAVRWPIAEVHDRRRAEHIVVAGVPDIPIGPWHEPMREAVVLPIGSSTAASGVLVVGVSPRRPLDDAYHTFFDLVASQIGTTIGAARAYEDECDRADELAALDRAKTAFFSNVSHEFRTPLTLILGPLEHVLSGELGKLTPDQREQLEVVVRNASRLQKLVSELLDFARIEACRAQACFAPTDLATLTRDIAGVFRSAVEDAGLALTIDCPRIEERLFVDRAMWEKIVLNLISNAFKFTWSGSIRVAMTVEPEAVRLEVADTGVGIPARELPRVFDRFHRIEGQRARCHEGSGIGLALVHDLVELHLGRIEVTSTEGTGTTFTVTIPRGWAHLPADQTHFEAPALEPSLVRAFVDETRAWSVGPARCGERQAAHARRIVVADDNGDMRDYVTRLLADEWQVEGVADGQAALELIERDPPDLVLADIMMPGMNGIELLRALRGSPRTAHLPILLLSARAGEDARVEGIQLGADDFVIKPFSGRELRARVRASLELARMRIEVGDANAANRAKDQFLAILGHELRNPMSPIVTTLELFRMRGATEEDLDVLERSVAHLARLIEDLVDVSRFSLGKLVLRRHPITLDAAIRLAIEMVAPVIEERKQKLLVQAQPATVTVDADLQRLTQAITNLLTNASKFSGPGARVELETERVGDRALVHVIDHGAGIAPGVVDSLFEPFVQEPQTWARANGGLGLGLTIAKSIVEAHGGTIGVRRGAAGGSVFTIALPVSAAPPEPVVEDTARREAPARLDKRILVVDDNQAAALGIKLALEHLGYSVEIAFDGERALAVASDFEPDIALLDIGLPGLSGYEVAQRLREQRTSQELQLIAITGFGQDSDRRAALAAGFDEHLVKPVNLARLRRVFEQLTD